MSVFGSRNAGWSKAALPSRLFVLSLLAVAALLLPARLAEAANRYWGTAGTGVWSNSANWYTTVTGFTNPAVAPGSGDGVRFNADPVVGASTVQLDSNISVLFISITGDTTFKSNNATVRNLTANSTNVAINFGSMTLDSTINMSLTSADTDVGFVRAGLANGMKAVLNINGATLNTRYLEAGTSGDATTPTATTSSGAINITAGSVVNITGTGATGTNYTFNLGGVASSYGYLNMTGGTVTSPRLQMGGDNATAGGIGVVRISGGTVNTASYVLLARSGNSAVGILTVDGGSIIHGGTNPFMLGYEDAGRAEFNMLSGTVTNANNTVQLGGLEGAAAFTGTAIVNLNGGTLTTKAFEKAAGSTARINFNGATLKSASTTAAFLPTMTSVYVNGAFGSFTGGANIDTNGFSDTISAALLAPTGIGVTNLAVTSGGSGYIGAPQVLISGGTGSGATAIANMVDDGTGNGTFKVGSITITNPGVYTVAPTFSFVGGGFTSAATIGAVTTAANTSGGLTLNDTAVTKGTLTLSGANTYTGTTLVSAGTLAYGASNVISTGAVTVNGASAILSLGTFSDSVGIVTLDGGGQINSTTGTLTSTGTFEMKSGTASAKFAGSGIVMNKTTAGTVTLSGASTFTGDLNVNDGALNLTGSINQGTTNGDATVGGVAGRAVLNINGGSLTTNMLQAGTIANGNGAINITALSNVTTNSTGNNAIFTFGGVTGSYGYLNMTGGTVTSPRLQLGGNNTSAGGIGIALISGGTLNTANYILLSRAGANAVGILTVTGGTVNHAGSSGIMLGYNHTGRAEFNMLGGTVNNPNNTVQLGGLEAGGPFTGTAIVNLNGGTLTTQAFEKASGSTARINFNGATVKSASTTTSFLPTMTSVYVNGAFGTFAGGAIIDTNGFSDTISAALLAPTGIGVSSLAVTNGGSGYIGAPQVLISGGTGAGGTAIANMVDDGTGNGTFKVGSITITNPGVYTVAPTFSFAGGGFTSAATIGAVSTAANTSGGLTKQGAGTLTLSGANTYAGTTLVSQGTLALSHASNNNISASKVIQINAGAILDVTGLAGSADLVLSSGQTIGGAGTIQGNLTVGTGSTIAAGSSPGLIAQIGNQTWTGAGNNNWQIYDANGAAGVGFDQINITGSLDLTGASGFNFNIWSLSGLGPDVNGNALNFNPLVSKSWTVVTTTGGIVGFDPSRFVVRTGAFNGTSGFSNAYGAGTFSLALSGTNNLNLVFTAEAVPEPGCLGMIFCASAVLCFVQRKRSRCN